MPRPAGSGKPKGFKHKGTLEKEAIRLRVRERVSQDLDALLDAQILNAKGIDHFFLRDKKSGKFERVEDPAQIQAALNAEGAEEGSHYWIFTKDPSTQAFTDLMNRAADKPAEQVQEIKVDGELVLKWQS